MNSRVHKLDFSAVEIIQNKKAKLENTSEELSWLILNYIEKIIPDYQMASWLMAVNFNGMSFKETSNYTKELIKSGSIIKFENDGREIIDKHSTGGVGDKVSLILAPILACMDYKIPMLAGRSLEHTGGTIDKLESIPGFKTNLSLTEFKNNVNKIGMGIMMQTNDICPADGKIYELRDVTATVNSLPLICGSILSKKIAEGISTLVLDIKTGNGAFMKNYQKANELGNLMKKIGKNFNLNVLPTFTGMDQPLGKTAGIWCEVIESYEFLQGNYSHDLYNVVLHLFKKFNPKQNTNAIFDDIILSGKGMNKFIEFIELQGGFSSKLVSKSVNNPSFSKDCFIKSNGFIKSMDTKMIGFALSELGVGRPYKYSNIDPTCGVEFYKKIGDEINPETPAFKIFSKNKQKLLIAEKKIKSAYYITNEITKKYNPIILN